MIDAKLKAAIENVYQGIAPDLELSFPDNDVEYTSAVEMTATCFETYCNDAEILKLWKAIPPGSVLDVVEQALSNYF